jgi:hypothetical protein
MGERMIDIPLPKSPRSLISMCILDWDIPSTYRDNLSEYYIRHWKTEYFFALPCYGVISDPNGNHPSVEYLTGYYNCLPPHLHSFNEILVSFRRIKKWNRGYCLIRPKLGSEK